MEKKNKQENISSKIVGTILFISAFMILVGGWVLSREVGKGGGYVEQPIIVEDGANTVSGQVNEVFEDCSRRRVFKDGEIVDKQDISCDGGSYLIVEGVQVYTSSGYTSAESYFEYDISNIDPGDMLQVTYDRGEFRNTINCGQCNIESL